MRFLRMTLTLKIVWKPKSVIFSSNDELFIAKCTWFLLKVLESLCMVGGYIYIFLGYKIKVTLVKCNVQVKYVMWRF